MRALWIGLAALAGGGLLFLLLVFWATLLSAVRRRGLPDRVFLRRMDPELRAWYLAQPFRRVCTRSHDGLTLWAYYLPGWDGATQAALFMHGYTDSHAVGGRFARIYHEQGYAVLLPDQRSHGQSQGRLITYGVREREDVARWVQLLTDRGMERIVLHGESMGAATLLQYAGAFSQAGHLPAQVAALVADCGYTVAQEEIAYWVRRHFLPPWPTVPLVSRYCRARYGFSLRDADSLAAAGHITLPTLIIHGRRDRFVPYPMGERIYAALNSERKALYAHAQAGHSGSWAADPAAYRERVLAFIGPHMAASNLSIRRAGPGDAPAVRAVLDAATEDLLARGVAQWTLPWPEQAVGGEIAAGRQMLLLAEGRVVGCFCVRTLERAPWPGVDGAGAWYLYRIALLPACQGRGWGRVICAWVLDHCPGRALLDCWAGNAALRDFYTRAGFTHLGDFPEADYRVSVFGWAPPPPRDGRPARSRRRAHD